MVDGAKNSTEWTRPGGPLGSVLFCFAVCAATNLPRSTERAFPGTRATAPMPRLPRPQTFWARRPVRRRSAEGPSLTPGRGFLEGTAETGWFCTATNSLSSVARIGTERDVSCLYGSVRYLAGVLERFVLLSKYDWGIRLLSLIHPFLVIDDERFSFPHEFQKPEDRKFGRASRISRAEIPRYYLSAIDFI